MPTIKYDNKAFLTTATIDCSQEVYEKVKVELNRIKKNIRRDMWKKGVKKK